MDWKHVRKLLKLEAKGFLLKPSEYQFLIRAVARSKKMYHRIKEQVEEEVKAAQVVKKIGGE